MMAESSEKVYRVPCCAKCEENVLVKTQRLSCEALESHAHVMHARKITCAGTRHCVRVWCPVYRKHLPVGRLSTAVPEERALVLGDHGNTAIMTDLHQLVLRGKLPGLISWWGPCSGGCGGCCCGLLLCSCLSHERSRRCRRRCAAPEPGCSLRSIPTTGDANQGTHWTDSLVVVVVVVVVRTDLEHGVSVQARMREQLIKSGPVPAHQPRQKYCASRLRVQVPGVPRGDINQPQGEEKGWQARQSHSRILRIWWCATFSITLALKALEPGMNRVPGTCLPG